MRSSASSRSDFSDTRASLSIDLHSLNLIVETHSQFFCDAIAAFFQSHKASAPFGQDYGGFRLFLEVSESAHALSVEPPSALVPGWFSVADVPLFFGQDRFYGRAADGSLAVEIDVVNRTVRANLGAALCQSEETFIYCFLRDLLRKFVYPFSGFICLHGAVVTKGDRAILFAGDTGAGKSTLAMQFFRDGYSIVSDDSPLVASGDGECLVMSSLDELSITANTLALFPELSPYVRGVRDVSGKLYISRALVPSSRLNLEPVRLTDYVVLQRENCSAPSLIPVERAGLAGSILKEYMSIFSRLRVEADPGYFAKIDRHTFDCLTSLLTGVNTSTLRYADEHIRMLAQLFHGRPT